MTMIKIKTKRVEWIGRFQEDGEGQKAGNAAVHGVAKSQTRLSDGTVELIDFALQQKPTEQWKATILQWKNMH